MPSLENIVESSWKFLKKKSLELGLCMSLLIGSSGCGDDRNKIIIEREVLEISGPISNPPVILAGNSTTINVSAYIPPSTVQLMDSNGVKIADMNDVGVNGDQVAGDNVYTTELIVNESSLDQLTYSIKATRDIVEEVKIRNLIIPVVKIPTIANDTEFNQKMDEVYTKAVEIQTLATNMNQNPSSATNTDLDQLEANLLSFYTKIEASEPYQQTSQKPSAFGKYLSLFGLFNKAKKNASINQLREVFAENPDDPRASDIRAWLLSNNLLTENDLKIMKKEDLMLHAKDYMVGSPNGSFKQFKDDYVKAGVKIVAGQPFNLVSDGLSTLYGANELGDIVIDELVSVGKSTFIDSFTDDKGDVGIIIGQTQDGEKFTVPSGTHDLVYSFGGSSAPSKVLDDIVASQQISQVYVSPGNISSMLEKIVFSSDRDAPGYSSIYTMDANGANLIKLTNNNQDYDAAWSPDKKKIAFIRFLSSNSQLYVMDSDGTKLTWLESQVAHPAWSPDGKKIVYTGSGGIHIWDNSGLSPIIYTIGVSGGINPIHPAWSPDGTKIAFMADGTSFIPGGLYVINPDGTNQTKLTVSELDVYYASPSWSPDGKKIAVTRSTPAEPEDIYIINSDGSNPVNITNSNAIREGDTSWSPDGKKILFDAVYGDFSKKDIYIMNSDGTNKTNLTNATTSFNGINQGAWR